MFCSCIRDAIAAVQDNVGSLEKQAADLIADQRNLEAKLKKRQQELERGEKRLQSLQTVRYVFALFRIFQTIFCYAFQYLTLLPGRRPAFMDEYEKLEGELAEEYEIYLEKFRNLDYLEHELDLHSKVWQHLRGICTNESNSVCIACLQREKEKLEAANRALKRLQKKLRDEELRMYMGDQVCAFTGAKFAWFVEVAASPVAALQEADTDAPDERRQAGAVGASKKGASRSARCDAVPYA